jgi:hypothetical protein
VLLGLLLVIGLSALVGCVGSDEGFSWELASIFGTALSPATAGAPEMGFAE